MYENKFDGITSSTGESFDFPIHSHYNLEICICTEGEVCAECNGQRMILQKGNAMIAFSNDIHGYASTEFGSQIIIIVSPRLFYEELRIALSNRYENFCLSNNSEVLRLAFKLQECVETKDMLLSVGYASLLLAHLIRDLPERSSISRMDEDIFTSIVKFISDHATEKITLRSVAGKFGMNYFNLSKLFKQKTSLTFLQYLHILRIEEAKAMLKNSSRSITEICYECGFSDIRTFNRVFKQVCNITPSEARTLLSAKNT